MHPTIYSTSATTRLHKVRGGQKMLHVNTSLQPPTLSASPPITHSLLADNENTQMAIIGGGGGGGGAAAAAAVVAAVVVAAAAVVAVVVEGQGSGVPDCVSKLVGCLQYLNGTGTPPATCCGPLKEAAVNETACLCAVLSDTNALHSLNIDPAQGLLLAKRCGVSVDSVTCSKATGTPTSSNGTASPASQNSGAVHCRSWTGAFSLTSLLFAVWAAMV